MTNYPENGLVKLPQPTQVTPFEDNVMSSVFLEYGCFQPNFKNALKIANRNHLNTYKKLLRHLCEAEGNIFTDGENEDYPGCKRCSCCKRLTDTKPKVSGGPVVPPNIQGWYINTPRSARGFP